MSGSKTVAREKIQDKLKFVQDSIGEQTSGYYNSTPIIETNRAAVEIRDFLLISALTGKNLMMSSSSGTGKTTLSRAFGKGIFDDDVGFVQIDPSLDENKFRDIMFGNIKRGDNLSGAVSARHAITAPIVVLDEFNRAPAILVSKVQNYLTNGILTFEGGKQMVPGVQLPGGGQYQWKVATINEGSDYAGTNAMDRASVDRFGAVLILDMFPPSDNDKRLIIQNGAFRVSGTPIDPDRVKELKENFFALYTEARRIEVDPIATEFLLALSNKDQCYKSPEGTKASLDSMNYSELCRGCGAAAVYKNVCGAISAPSIRAIEDLKDLSKTYVLVTRGDGDRAKMRVGIDDVLAVSNFALLKKMKIDESWVSANASNSSPYAVSIAMKELYTRFVDSMKKLHTIMRKESDGVELSVDDRRKLGDAIRCDPSFRPRGDIIEFQQQMASNTNQ